MRIGLTGWERSFIRYCKLKFGHADIVIYAQTRIGPRKRDE